MKRSNVAAILVLPVVLVSFGSCAAACEDPKSSDEIAQCLGNDLRDADAKINAAYRELMIRLGETERNSLRVAQRAWIRERDAVCRLDTKETDRERWYAALLKDYAKTVCVTKYTRRRTSDLDVLLGKGAGTGQQAAAAPRSASAADPAPVPKQELAYDKRPVTPHANGKWYFEFKVNYSEAVKIEPMALTIGVTDEKQLHGVLDNIRGRDARKESLTYGFAVDLDQGKLYVSRNGQWENGEPGSSRGHDLKLGRTYYSFFMVSADSPTPYIERGALAPNFGGDKAMTYALPAGYKPWRN
jgi:uncharacterized protein YecT (DUF1311 family)